MTKVFIDSGPLRAAKNAGDQYFSQARAGLTSLAQHFTPLLTSDYIIDEVYTGLLTRWNYESAMQFDSYLRKSEVQIEHITHERFIKAQEIFRRYNKDKKWSFTDCTSYVVMKELKINTVFTFDQNFKQMGFKVL